MISNGIQSTDAAEPHATTATTQSHHRLRLLIVMAQGRAGALPEAWRSYAQVEDARAGALEALRNPQVLSVAIVEDGSALIGPANPLRFVEWADNLHEIDEGSAFQLRSARCSSE
jgi:hypothetical protein